MHKLYSIDCKVCFDSTVLKEITNIRKDNRHCCSDKLLCKGPRGEIKPIFTAVKTEKYMNIF